MKYTAEIDTMLHPGLLDPQDMVVANGITETYSFIGKAAQP